MARCCCVSNASARIRRSRGSPRSWAARTPKRPRVQVAGELAAGRFVARVLALTALTAIGWGFFDPSRVRRVGRGTRGFPALRLRTRGSRRFHACTRGAGASRRACRKAGRDPGAGRITHALFDKTGTLTETHVVTRRRAVDRPEPRRLAPGPTLARRESPSRGARDRSRGCGHR